MDELIDRGVKEARQTEESARGMGDAILAMRAEPRKSGMPRMALPLGLGTAVLVTGVLVVAGTITGPNAYASSLQAVAQNAQKQQTMHKVSYLYGVSGKPVNIMEYWVDHGTVAFRQYTNTGKLFVARVNDGTTTWHYVSGDAESGRKPWASYEKDSSKDTEIYSAFEILNGTYVRKHSIEKKTGVKFNGVACDYYSIAGGAYQYWIDPSMKLPLKLEIYNGSGELWKKDIYDYPKSFPSGTFKPYQEPGVTYIDYTAERQRLREKYGDPGQPERAGSGGK